LDKITTMKKYLTLLFCLPIFFFHAQAQFLPGTFYHDVDNGSYYNYSSSPIYSCVVGAALYTIRYGGVERFSASTDSVDYLWDRFYDPQVIKRAPQSSMIALRGGLVYRYYPANDSMVNISDSLPAPTVTDIDASDSVIWAIVDFNEIGRYTNSSGWQIIGLGGSFNPDRILARTDTSVYLTDGINVYLYTPSGLSSSLLTFNTINKLTEWCIDTAGNAWMIDNDTVISLTPAGAASFYSYGNTPLTLYDIFQHITSDRRGNVWVASEYGYIYRYNAAMAWNGFNLQIYAQSLTSDPVTSDVYLVDGNADSLYILNDSLAIYPNYTFGNMPYQNITAISTYNIATPQGIFDYSAQSAFAPSYFTDTTATPYANKVTCFVVNGLAGDTGYGTNHGVFNTMVPINNANLPDSNINYIYYAMGSYYIATDKGLCVYNQVVYTTYDTSNSGLPSDSVTFVISYLSPYTNAQELWVGTKTGVALYTNGVWTRFDTSVVHVPNFNVTGILPCPLYYANPDTSVWITTMGGGLVKLKRNGVYTVLNTVNSGFDDDSLYYITQYQGCDYYGTVIIGTNSHGIAYYVLQGDTFGYSTTGYYNGGIATYHRSNLFVNTFAYQQYNYNGQMILTTDQGLLYAGVCIAEGLKNTSPNPNTLKWYQENDDMLRVQVPQDYTGVTGFGLYDMTGRKVLASIQDVQSGNASYLDISSLTMGVYVLQAANGNNTIQTKIIISR